ncbi:MAG: hypothetical protein MZV49_23575 [Rhodopseudomonas palustris]|nr:hypothetical protein [Rhodopseudomonas palustris]
MQIDPENFIIRAGPRATSFLSLPLTKGIRGMTARSLQQPTLLNSLMGWWQALPSTTGTPTPATSSTAVRGLPSCSTPISGTQPSSIHNWPFGGFDALLVNLGILHEDLGHFGPDITADERNRLERGIRRRHRGCALLREAA